jgi:very-short-patch-repair endonuclease
LFVQQLNVAVSRAKDQLHIFHSFDIDNLHDNDARQELFRLAPLSNYLLEEALEKCQSEFEKDVVKALHDADPSLKISTQVAALGYSIDIVLEDENGHQLAVECDGDRWHTADEDMRRDLYRQRALERIGWRFERFLASQWYQNPQRLTSQVINAMQTRAAPPRRAYDRKRRGAPVQTTTSRTGSTPPSLEPVAARQPHDIEPPQDSSKSHPRDVGQETTAEYEIVTEETVVKEAQQPVARLNDQNTDVTRASGTASQSTRPRLPVRTTEFPAPTSPASNLPPPETAKERNRALAQALRDLGKETGGEVWQRAKKHLADGDSIQEAARKA